MPFLFAADFGQFGANVFQIMQVVPIIACVIVGGVFAGVALFFGNNARINGFEDEPDCLAAKRNDCGHGVSTMPQNGQKAIWIADDPPS